MSEEKKRILAVANSLTFSRELAAGYRPNVLAEAKVLVVGCGALGQNLSLNLGLIEVGSLILVDFDEFSPHNRSRSPFYPNVAFQRRFGNAKARIVANKLSLQLTSQNRTSIEYFNGPIQALGDSVFHNASVIISAVDNAAARAWLAEMTRKHRKPLVEGGFVAADISMAVYLNKPNGPCWRCSWSDSVDAVRLSCDAFAEEIESQGFVPAIQPAAAMLASLMAEAAVQLLHESCPLTNQRLYANVRTGRSSTFNLALNPDCPGRHDPLSGSLRRLATTIDSPANSLCDEVSQYLDDPIIALPAGFVEHLPCQRCHEVIGVNSPIWSIQRQPRCAECDGRWPRLAATPTIPLAIHYALTHGSRSLHNFTCGNLGIADGAILEVSNNAGETLLFELSTTGANPLIAVPSPT